MRAPLVTLLLATAPGLFAQASLRSQYSSYSIAISNGCTTLTGNGVLIEIDCSGQALAFGIGVSSSGAPITFTVSTSSQGLTAVCYPPSNTGLSNVCTTGTTIDITVNQIEIPAGTYNGNITLTSPGAANSPFTIPITVFGGTETTGTTPAANMSGTWDLTAHSVFGLTFTFTGAITQTGNVLSGQLTGNSPCASSSSLSGTISGDALTMNLNENGQVVVLSGSVASDGNSASGTYQAPAGGCTQGDSGTWSGTRQVTPVAPTISLAVSPTMLSFLATAGSPPPPTQYFSVSIAPPNSSVPAATAAVTQGGTWLSVSNVGSGLFAVSVNPIGLAVGTYSGSIAVSVPGASNSPVAIPVTLRVAGVTVSGVLNAASYAKNSDGNGSPVAPGSLVQIYTTLPGATAANATTLPFPTSLGGVSVTFNGTPAAISAVIPTGAYPLINAQVPFEVLTSGASITANVIVTVNEMASAPFPVAIVPAAPGIFTTTQSGQGQAILFSLTGQIATPTNPISRGATAVLYTTGLGALLPEVPDGAASPVSQSIATPTVWIGVPNGIGVPTGEITAQVLYAGQAPDYPGVNQINIVIPEGVATGNAIPLQIQTADGSLTTSNVTIAIQ